MSITDLNCEPTYEELKPNTTFNELKKKHPNCEPTYEELKHHLKPFFENLFLHCEPTYEELKPFIQSIQLTPRGNCEPTYEELKLTYQDSPHMGNQRIASLPMRNWNIATAQRELNKVKIASLPMRNWNC